MMSNNGVGPIETRFSPLRLDIVLTKPEKSNALAADTVEALIAALDEAQSRNLRCIAIRGTGYNFCAGLDLSDIAKLADQDIVYRLIRIEVMLQKIAYGPFVSVVLAHGKTVGAGVDLLAAGSFRYVLPGTSLRMPGWQFDIALGTSRLVSRIGQGRALDWLMDAKTIEKDEAVSIGFAQSAESLTSFQTECERLENRLAGLSQNAFQDLVAATRKGSPDAELGLLARTASRPGIRERILAYAARNAAGKSAADKAAAR